MSQDSNRGIIDPAEQIIFPESVYRHLRSRAPYSDLPFLAIGSMSVVLEHPDGVLRLSRDGGTQRFLSEAGRLDLSGVARILDDRGAVAPADDDQGYGEGDFIWAAVIERLEPINEGEPEYLSLQSLDWHLGQALDGPLIDYRDAPRLAGIATAISQEHPILTDALAACIQLMDVIRGFQMDLDLSPSNFMRRPATGEVVLSDPIGSSSIRPSDIEIARLNPKYNIR